MHTFTRTVMYSRYLGLGRGTSRLVSLFPVSVAHFRAYTPYFSLQAMLLPKANRTAIYTFLFKEGVCCCKKDTTSQHDQIPVPNLHVMKLMLSLKSRNFVVEKFNWQWYYYTLTTEGIDYLRSYLHLDSDTVPATHKKENKVKPTPRYTIMICVVAL